ncbi:MAG: hypothetical protein Q7S23_01175, partial [bacterium]|nr:hypothetical protein [bacterium]
MPRIQNVLVVFGRQSSVAYAPKLQRRSASATLVGIVVALVVSLAPVATPVLTVATVVVLSSPAHAQVQPPEVEWERTFGGTNFDQANSVGQTTDGGYIVVGLTKSFGAGEADVYIVKSDANGDISSGWPKTFGGKLWDEAHSTQQTSDGGYIVGGMTTSFGAGGVDVYLIKTDADGIVAPGWPKTFGGSDFDSAREIHQTNDGGYIVAGVTHSLGAGRGDVYLIKTDADGIVAPGWPKTFGGTGWDEASSVQQTDDGGYIAAGFTESFGLGDRDVYLIKTEADGTISPGWPKIFGGTGWDEASSVQQTDDGGYIVAGQTYSFGAGGGDVYLIKTEADGTISPGWPKTFGGPEEEIAYAVHQTIDDGYIVAGLINPVVAGATGILIKTDASGLINPGWQVALEGIRGGITLSIEQTSDSGYIAAGYTNKFGAGGYDVYLVKLGPERPAPPTRHQLHLFRDNQFVPLTDAARADFDPALPAIVIVHGFNFFLTPQLPSWTLEVAQSFASRKLTPYVNILAWDWQLEAQGGDNPVDGGRFRVAASLVHDQSLRLAKALSQLFAARGFAQPVHLMGHSLGAPLGAYTAINLQDPAVSNPTYPVANVTLWDPPDRSPFVERAIETSLTSTVPYLRRNYPTLVDCYRSELNAKSYFSNVWYASAGPGHGESYAWYQRHVKILTEEPTLHRRVNCDDTALSATIGFGASQIHTPPDRQLRFTPCQAGELDVSLVAHSADQNCSPDSELVFAQYCVVNAENVSVITVALEPGVSSTECDCTVTPDLKNLRMQLRRRQALQGGGAGLDDLTATYTLPLTVAEPWDFLQFGYKFVAVPAPAALNVSVIDGVAETPLLSLTSEPNHIGVERLSPLLDISSFRGKTVDLV